MARRITIHQTISSIRKASNALSEKSVGFVPTMGALHDGHLSLVREARAKNDVVIASLFVNPTQFGLNEDLDKYPRQFERDAELLEQFGVDHLFAPPTNEVMYGAKHITYVDPQGFDEIPEGIKRPGFFRGVATIVTKLFNIVNPTRAYFGQKDAAQCCLIKRIVEDLNMDIEVCVLETVREDDGLAMSSRNAYLSAEERAASPIVYQSLCAAQEKFADRKSDLTSTELKDAVVAKLNSEPLVSEIQYVSIDDTETMRPIDIVGDTGAVVSLACIVGSVR
eukprot:CAMPEP_0178928540 /NCGR_PEP_ID=MMETSP0786-20121207/19967_1 /TAXON_ID=186022 /ORGANISM="Thalassionema frauenfeldii, Strain CCMP 1798" /LENGTH=279 /DNA_ID=CAMNT_0020604429 /DNA_START=70 /DNA_END=906 /DNA_ORIENTATION=+